MREIKFRGRCLDGWIYSECIWFNEFPTLNDRQIYMPNTNNENCDELNIETWDMVFDIGQYTGLKDKNGKEIFEGDILSYKHITYTDCSKTKIEEIEDESFIEIITYAPMASIVKPHSKNVKCFGYDNVNKECLILDLTSDEVEIIGNIYENPELLG